MASLVAYTPLGVLKPFAPSLWIVDGPEIGMRVLGMRMPFPTRMTVVRLPSGRLWVHSPIAWDDALGAALAELGEVAFLVAPNTLHYWYLEDWQARFPAARSYAPPGLARRARKPVRVDETLGDGPPAAWEGCFEQAVALGPILTEAVFWHIPSRTLILTDLIENFELRRVRSRLLRWVLGVAGGADPDGRAPWDMRLSFLGHRRKLRAVVARMVAWAPERIVVAHGRCYDGDGITELRRAFRWIL